VNLGPTDPQNAGFDASGHLPYTVSGTQVFFNGIQAPLLSVGNQQLVAEVPFGVTVSDTVAIDVRANSQTSNTVELPGGAAEPQIVLLPQDNSGFRSAAALNQDGTVNTADHLATGGEILSVFVNGAGALNPAPEDGTPGRVGRRVDGFGRGWRRPSTCGRGLRRRRAGNDRRDANQPSFTATSVFAPESDTLIDLHRQGTNGSVLLDGTLGITSTDFADTLATSFQTWQITFRSVATH